MATLFLNVLTDGQPFVASLHNQNLFSKVRGKGLHSEGNGGFESQNISTSFELTSEHIMDGMSSVGFNGGSTTTLDNMGDANTDITSTVSENVLNSQGLPGCSLRVWIPFKPSTVIYRASFFWHCARYKFPDVQGAPSDPAIATRITVNGIQQRSLQRTYPPTFFQSHAGVVFAESSPAVTHSTDWLLRVTEGRVSQHFDFVHMVHDGDMGWHDVSLNFLVGAMDSSANPIPIDSQNRYNGLELEAQKSVDWHNRFTVGCRGATIVAYI